MIDWPSQLVNDLARRRAILFLGSGVSKNSVSESDPNRRPPNWLEFLERALVLCPNPKKHIQALLKQQNYLTACEIIKHKLEDRWNQFVHEEFVEPKFQAAEIHSDIFRLDSRIVLTQNVDRIYDAFALKESSGTVYVKEHSKADVALVVRGERRCVLKAHGTVDTPNEMIFTREEYARARVAHHSFYSVLDALTITHTLLFIGCGVADPDVQIMLERHAYTFPTSRPHYMIAPKGAYHAELESSLKRNMNVKFLFYKPSDGHLELRTSIADLVQRVESERENLAKTRDW